MKLSILIPVYKKPKLVSDILAKLLSNDYGEKECHVIVDGQTNPQIEQALDPFREKIQVYYNNAQLGKAKSLNNIASTLASEVLVFFDNDILVPDDPEFLSRVAREFEKHDIAEFPKEAISKTFLSKILGFEFLSTAICSFSFAAIANRCPGMNGAAFAIKKELFDDLKGFDSVINEDMDLAFNAFLRHARFSYNPSLKVGNQLPENAKEWLSQRKRWAINNVLWLKTHFWEIIRNFFRSRRFRLAATTLIMPGILFSILYFVLRAIKMSSLFTFFIILGMHYQMFLGLLLGLAQFHNVIDGIIPVLIGLVSTAAFNFVLSKILRFHFNFPAFILFYLFYLPLWFVANLFFGLGVLLNIEFKLDWKVTK